MEKAKGNRWMELNAWNILGAGRTGQTIGVSWEFRRHRTQWAWATWLVLSGVDSRQAGRRVGRMAASIDCIDRIHNDGPDRPWRTCVVPLALFLTAGAIEPTPAGGGIAGAMGIPYIAYPWLHAVRLAATVAMLVSCWPAIYRWVGRPSWWPPLLGLCLVVPWIMLAGFQRDAGWAVSAIERSAFDPFAHFGSGSLAAWGFLFVRGMGLVVVVPIVEELFLRGFLMRYVIRENFWTVPFGTLTLASAGASTLYAAFAHPAEAVAAVAWFAVVSGIAAATRRPIDAILAHAATNLALGAYVLATGNWWLV